MSEFQNTDFEDNPYRSPAESGDSPFAGDAIEQVVTPTILTVLSQTQPWVRFLSVLGFIASGLMLLGGLVGSIVAMGRPMGFACLIYVLFGFLYFFPSLFLSRYASRIADLRMTRGVRQLESALTAQKSFWKFVGIAAMIIIFVYLATIAAFIFLPLVMSASRSH